MQLTYSKNIKAWLVKSQDGEPIAGGINLDQVLLDAITIIIQSKCLHIHRDNFFCLDCGKYL